MTQPDAIYLASRAKEVLDNEAFSQAFDAINAEITQQWTNAPARDVDGRERLWLMQSLLSKLRITLESTIASGKLKAEDLRYKQTMKERMNDWLR